MHTAKLTRDRLYARLAMYMSLLFTCALVGCGSGGPDDPATIQALKDLNVLVVPNTNGQVNGLNALPTDPAKLTEAIGLAAKLNALKTITAMDGVPLSDDHLATIGGIGSLVELTMENAPISDAGIASLTGCKKLESLSLVGTKVTSEALSSLGKLPKLNMLNINDTQVKGGFDALQACSNLQWVLIGGLNISEEDAAAIAKIPAISHVTYTNKTQISEDAIKALKTNRQCQVDVVNVPEPAAATP